MSRENVTRPIPVSEFAELLSIFERTYAVAERIRLSVISLKLLRKNSEQYLAERVGFEPTCRLPDNTLSRRARYDHFGTSPLGESQ